MARGTGGIGRFYYGGVALWIPRGNLGGSRALRVAERLELHFQEGGGPLLFDLRELHFVDSVGAGALKSSVTRHPGLTLVGLPQDFDNLPLSIRVSLAILRPLPGIEAALSVLPHSVSSLPSEEERRHAPRIRVQIPVELMFQAESAAATFYDLSRSGGRLGRIPREWVKDLRPAGEDTELGIFDLEKDPLGMEITRRFRSPSLLSHPVHILPEGGGLGLRFFSGHGAARPRIPDDPDPA